MVTRHFFNTLITFLAIIVLGLLGVFLASYFSDNEIQSKESKKTQTSARIEIETKVAE